MQTLAFANQKGGVGKSTSALTLGSLMAAAGRRVLLVDTDPQASTTQAAGIVSDSSLADVIGGSEAGSLAITETIKPVHPGLDLVPGDLALASCELGLTQRWGREIVIKAALASVTGYDVCLIDCPPSLGLLTVAALTAAQGVICPTLPAAPDLRGLKLFLGSLEKLRKAGLNPALQLAGVIVVQFDRRLTAHNQALETLLAAGLPVLMPPVPRSIRVQEAAGAKVPLPTYDPNGRTTAAYQEITKEVIKWLDRL